MPDSRPFGDIVHHVQIEQMYVPLLAKVRKYFLFRLGRGWDKTSGIAFYCLSQILLAKRKIKIAIFSSDLEQAAIMLDEVRNFIDRSELLRVIGIKINKFEISFGGSSIKIMSADGVSSFGGLYDIIVIDEFSSWSTDNHQTLFYSIYTTIAKKADSVLIVLSNAIAAFSKVLIEILPKIKESNEWHVFEADYPASWLNQKNLEEQKRFLPPLVYARLFENLDVPQSGNFISLNELETCIDSNLKPVEHGKEGITYFCGFDYGRKNDRSACVTVHQEGDFIILDDVWFTKGSREHPVKFEVVENYLLTLASRFQLGSCLTDPYQMQNTAEKLRDAVPMTEFIFNQASWNLLARNLYDSIHFAKLRMFENSVMKNELLQLQLVETPLGLKFDHERRKGHYSDIATALALAITAGMQSGFDLGANAFFFSKEISAAEQLNIALGYTAPQADPKRPRHIYYTNPPSDLTAAEIERHNRRDEEDPLRDDMKQFGLI